MSGTGKFHGQADPDPRTSSLQSPVMSTPVYPLTQFEVSLPHWESDGGHRGSDEGCLVPGGRQWLGGHALLTSPKSSSGGPRPAVCLGEDHSSLRPSSSSGLRPCLYSWSHSLPPSWLWAQTEVLVLRVGERRAQRGSRSTSRASLCCLRRSTVHRTCRAPESYTVPTLTLHRNHAGAHSHWTWIRPTPRRESSTPTSVRQTNSPRVHGRVPPPGESVGSRPVPTCWDLRCRGKDTRTDMDELRSRVVVFHRRGTCALLVRT